jgi:hypothetical protein
MTDKMRGAYPSQTEVEQPQGFSAVNFYENGLVGHQQERPSLTFLQQLYRTVESQPLSPWKKVMLTLGGLSLIATACSPALLAAPPVVLDSATGNAPDAPHLSPSPTPEIMPSLSPTPSIFPSLTPTAVMSPTEIRPSFTPTDITPFLTPIKTPTPTNTERPTKTPTPTKTEKPTLTPSPTLTKTPEPSPTPSGLWCNETSKSLTNYVKDTEILLAKDQLPKKKILQAVINFGDDPDTQWITESPVCMGVAMNEKEMRDIYGQYVPDTEKCTKEALQELVDKWGTEFSYLPNNTQWFLEPNSNGTDKCGYVKQPVTKEVRDDIIRLFGRIPYPKTVRIPTPTSTPTKVK